MEEKHNIYERHETPQQNVPTYSEDVISEDNSIGGIESEIKTLESEINSRLGNANPQLKGYMAEDWARGIFNIAAAIKQIGGPDEEPK
jgi:hypothetical protein